MSAEMKEFKIKCSWDADVMNAMMTDETISRETKNKLKLIKKDAKNHNSKTDIYKWTNDKCIGRLFAKHSLQTLERHIRNALLNHKYFELDMKNAHYNFLEQIGNKYSLKTTEIAYYNNNREECLKKINENRDVAKELYLRAEYGANIPELKDLTTECVNIIARMKSDELYKTVLDYATKSYNAKSAKEKEYKSLDHSFLAHALQSIECQCIQSIMTFLKENESTKPHINIILHDGLVIEKNDLFTKEYIKQIEEFVFEDVEWKVNLDKKELPHNYVVGNVLLASCEQQACELIYNKHKKDIIRAVDDWYIHLPHTNHWSKGEGALRVLVKGMEIWKTTNNGITPYSHTKSGLNAIIEYLTTSCDNLFPVNKTFIDDVNKKTEGMVFYTDMYYDLNNKIFRQIQSDNLPIVYIDRTAPDLGSITNKEIETYKEKYLNMFEKDELPIILKTFARALAGHITDKVWYSMCGLRNTGKGVFQCIFKHSFAEYVVCFDMPMVKTSNKQDASDLRWVITTGCHLKRVAFSNEVQAINGLDPIIDGGVIKKVIASGGDTILARGLYKDEMDIINNTITFASLNGNPNTEPKDALSNCIPFRMPYKFVDNPNDITEKKSDDSIKYKIATDRNRDIFTKILFDAYGKKVIANDLSQRMKEDLNEICFGNVNEPLYILRNKFRKPTQQEIENKEDYTTFNEIKHIFKPAKMTDTKLGRFLKERGYKKVLKTTIKKNDTVAYKIKVVIETVDDADAEVESEDCTPE